MTKALICDAIFDNNAAALLKHRCPRLMWPACAARCGLAPTRRLSAVRLGKQNLKDEASYRAADGTRLAQFVRARTPPGSFSMEPALACKPPQGAVPCQRLNWSSSLKSATTKSQTESDCLILWSVVRAFLLLVMIQSEAQPIPNT